MNNPSVLFNGAAMQLAARRRLREGAARSLWQSVCAAWREALQRHRDAAALEALSELDEHMLRDIGADDELLNRAAISRERREHPFAPASPAGIELASRRLG